MKFSLSQKIIFIVIGSILFFGVLATSAVFYYNKNFLEKNLEEKISVIAVDKAQDVTNVVANVGLLSQSIANNEIVVNYLKDSEEDNFSEEKMSDCLNFYDEKDIYSAIYVINKEGDVLISTESTFVGNNYSFRNYFQKAMSGESYVDISLGVTSKKLGYYFSHPIKNEEGVILGVLVIKLNPTVINSYLSGFDELDFSDLMLVDNKGVIFYSSKEENLYHSLGELSENDLFVEKNTRFPEVELFSLEYDEIQSELNNIAKFKLFKAHNEKNIVNEYIGVAAVSNGPFYVVIKEDFDQYMSSALRVSYILALFIIISALVSGISISLFIIRFLRPIKDLNKVANQVSEGDFKIQINTNTGSKDLDVLSSSFNLMVKNVKQSRDMINEEVKDKTKEIIVRQGQMENQQKAILNILEDVEEAREDLDQKYVEVEVIKDLTQNLGLSIDPLQIMDYLIPAINKLYPELIISHVEISTDIDKFFKVIHIHTPFELNDKCINDLRKKVLNGFNKVPLEIKNKINLKKWLKQDFELKIFKDKNVPKIDHLVKDSVNNLFIVPGVVTSSVNISSIKNEVINESAQEVINIIFENAKQMISNMRDLVSSEHSRLEDLMESMTNGVLMFDLNGAVVTTNDAFTKMTGLSKEKVILVDFLKFFQKSGQGIDSDIKNNVLQEGKILHFDEVEMARFTYEIYIAPMRDYQNKISGGVVVLHDITQIKAIDKMKTEFVSVASHQLRTPLTAMNWFIEMLLSGDAGKLSGEQKNYVEEVYRGSTRMVILVNDLLNVSRLEAGRLKIQPKAIDIVKFVQEIIKDAEPLSKKKGCKIIFSKPVKKLPKIAIDPSLMQQVVHNLITNAIKYSKDKNCQVKVVLKKRKNDYLISVTDSGIGISKEDQSRLFEKFFRADSAVQISAEGTGLGLYIAKMIIEASGGKIWLKSIIGKGSTFHVTIPIKGMKKQQGEKGLA